MMSIGYRIGTVLVPSCGRVDSPNYYWNANHAGDLSARLQLVRRSIEAAQRSDCRVVVLPAGLFYFESPQERQAIEHRVCEIVAGLELLIAFGIDQRVRGGDTTTGGEGATVSDEEDYFGYTVYQGTMLLGPVRQTGTKTDQVSED